ncbi:hypothetical protein AURDEDRAFT_120968 [Auricularia subglabra TFB-10046 SS5]|nr:hypothetical protein AURDEDRAFT_120968 [Auricularia subglabra TFB-10046 SS5]
MPHETAPLNGAAGAAPGTLSPKKTRQRECEEVERWNREYGAGSASPKDRRARRKTVEKLAAQTSSVLDDDSESDPTYDPTSPPTSQSTTAGAEEWAGESPLSSPTWSRAGTVTSERDAAFEGHAGPPAQQSIEAPRGLYHRLAASWPGVQLMPVERYGVLFLGCMLAAIVLLLVYKWTTSGNAFEAATRLTKEAATTLRGLALSTVLGTAGAVLVGVAGIGAVVANFPLAALALVLVCLFVRFFQTSEAKNGVECLIVPGTVVS